MNIPQASVNWIHTRGLVSKAFQDIQVHLFFIHLGVQVLTPFTGTAMTLCLKLPFPSLIHGRIMSSGRETPLFLSSHTPFALSPMPQTYVVSFSPSTFRPTPFHDRWIMHFIDFKPHGTVTKCTPNLQMFSSTGPCSLHGTSSNFLFTIQTLTLSIGPLQTAVIFPLGAFIVPRRQIKISPLFNTYGRYTSVDVQGVITRHHTLYFGPSNVFRLAKVNTTPY
ncbi:hypothetical protein C8Q75DRAFT_589661 [Abortiporus biennis]|nr:hypothetical protein C8Q75DRAFT_589661 [Abortiporus biennis]